MSIEPSKLAAIEFASAVIALPLVFWLTMYWAARWWSINWRPILPWLMFLRWVGWGCGAAMVLISLARSVSPGYGLSMLGFSTGLSLPQSWVKRRFANSINSN
jgi:hypothetical protein